MVHKHRSRKIVTKEKVAPSSFKHLAVRDKKIKRKKKKKVKKRKKRKIEEKTQDVQRNEKTQSK